MTNYVIAHLPYSSSRLTDHHGLIGDSSLLIERTTERYLDELFTADEKVEFPWSRLCCDVGAYMCDGPTADLVPRFYRGHHIRPDPSQQQIATAITVAQRHVLRLLTAVEHANSLLNVIVLDARSFNESTVGGTLPLADICLGFNEPQPTPVVVTLAEFFEHKGRNVALNNPVQGCFLPRAYAGHSSTFGVTVALNQRLITVKNGQLDVWGANPMKMMLGEMYAQLTNHLL